MRECTFTPEVHGFSYSYQNQQDLKPAIDKSTYYERSTERCKRHQGEVDTPPAKETPLPSASHLEPKIPKSSERSNRSKALRSNRKSVENTISRMREAALENKI